MLLLLFACEPDHAGEGVPGTLVKARLENVELSSYFIVMGGVGGHADLVVRNDAGDRFEAPVELSGFVAGPFLEGSVAIGGPVRMFLPDDEVSAKDLFSVYSGAATSLAAGVGIATHHLENERGVQIDVALFEMGVGLRIAFETLGLDQAGSFLAPTDFDSGGDSGGDSGADSWEESGEESDEDQRDTGGEGE